MSEPDSRLAGLYVITDPLLHAGKGLEAGVRAALEGGARLVQYRDKSDDARRRFQEAHALARLCETYGALLIVNDDVLLARAAGAQGVHLGRHDGSVPKARDLLGDAAIIGVSCYNELARAERAAAAGANYLAFGSVFPSSVKPEAVQAPLNLFKEARAFELPLCAIGGIDRGNIGKVVAAGADMAAVISAVFAAEDVEAAARELSGAFGNGEARSKE